LAAALTPHQALVYLRELSPAVSAACVLDRDGAPLAGDASLAGVGDDGHVVARARHGAIVARLGEGAGDGALVALARADATLALAAVRDRC
jgi:hypothetical protein